MPSRRKGSERIVAQVEAGDGCGLLRAPVSDAEVAVFALVELCAGCDQAQAPRPVHSQIVIGEIRGMPEMRIPAFTRADVEHAVSGVLNHVSSIAEAQGELSASRGSRREHHVEEVVAARAAFAQSDAFVLKIGERFAVLAADLFDV